jgi:predicted component of viral defense system (DUF524 family)
LGRERNGSGLNSTNTSLFLNGHEVAGSKLETWRTYFIAVDEISVDPPGAWELYRQAPGLWTLSTGGWMGSGTLAVDGKEVVFTVRDWKLDEGEWGAILDDLSEAVAGLPLTPFTTGSALEFDTRPGTRFVQYLLLRSMIAEVREALGRIHFRPNEVTSRVMEHVDPAMAATADPASVVEALSSGHLERFDGRGPIGGAYPSRWEETRVRPSHDTPENRFVRHAVESMLEILTPFKGEAVADELATALRRALSYRPLCEAGRYRGYPRHSQVLLRSPGYRTLRQAYFLLLGGAKVNWSGAESSLRGGLRNAEWLYEAWVFLELQHQIGVQRPRLPVRPTRDGLHIDLERGYESRVSIPDGELYYNRSYLRGSGSYSLTVRPDFSLHWSDGTVTVLDAKHRLGEAGAAKEDDIVKMHAYRDILTPSTCRSAWVLHPGSRDTFYAVDDMPEARLRPLNAGLERLRKHGVGTIPFKPKEKA